MFDQKNPGIAGITGVLCLFLSSLAVLLRIVCQSGGGRQLWITRFAASRSFSINSRSSRFM